MLVVRSVSLSRSRALCAQRSLPAGCTASRGASSWGTTSWGTSSCGTTFRGTSSWGTTFRGTTSWGSTSWGSTFRGTASYVQGQSPEPRIREYFYYVDHQGQLFLDDTKVKNFVTCFKDKKFLVFFFSRLQLNRTGRYQEAFPFLSLCGRERNFLRCDDRPVVFTHLLQNQEDPAGELLSYCGGADKLTVPFRPEEIYMHPVSGRVYHPCSQRGGSVGLVRSALAIELSPCFVYAEDSQSAQPTHFLWRGQKHKLTNGLAGHFPTGLEEGGSGHQGELGQ